MLYRVIIKSATGAIYYLTDDNTAPATDSFVSSDSVQFLNELEPSAAHSFSTLDAANAAITSLPYPYNEKAIVIEVQPGETRLAKRIYYRILLNRLRRPQVWASIEGAFDEVISTQTAFFETLAGAEEFKSSLGGFNEKQSKIVEVHDYGAPDYDFDFAVVGTGEWFRCDDANETILSV